MLTADGADPNDPKLPEPPNSSGPLAGGAGALEPGVSWGLAAPKRLLPPAPNPPKPVDGAVDDGAAGVLELGAPAAGWEPKAVEPNTLVVPNAGLAGVEAGVVDPCTPPNKLDPPKADGAGVPAGELVPPAGVADPGVAGGCPKMFGRALVPDDALFELLPKEFPPENAPKPPLPNEDILVYS